MILSIRLRSGLWEYHFQSQRLVCVIHSMTSFKIWGQCPVRTQLYFNQLSEGSFIYFLNHLILLALSLGAMRGLKVDHWLVPPYRDSTGILLLCCSWFEVMLRNTFYHFYVCQLFHSCVCSASPAQAWLISLKEVLNRWSHKPKSFKKGKV